MPNQQAATIAEILVKRWIHTYGEPSQVHSDQGSNFMSELVTQVCEIYDIEKTLRRPIIRRVMVKLSAIIKL